MERRDSSAPLGGEDAGRVWFEMTRSAVAATAVAALLLVGCGHAVRDSVKTSGEAAERAVREWERSQSALVLAEDARNAARDAAASAADPPSLGNRDDFIEDLADDARDRAEDAKDRADDARDRAKDVHARARDAEEGAKKASEWMSGKGFYTSEQYWDCDRYRRHEAFEDQPEACQHANEARALAEVVRWRADRAQTVAEHARALAYETRSLAQRAEAERRPGGRLRLLAEAEQLQEQAADTLAAARAAYAEQNREWQGLQARAGRWLEDAERTYAAIKGDGGGGWASALLGGAIGAVAGAAGASALGLTGSAALELATVTTVAGAEAGAGGDGTLTQAAVDAVSDGGVTPPVAGTAAGTDPALDEALDSIAAGLVTRADGGRAGAGVFDAGVRTSEEAPGAPGRRRSPAGGGAGGGGTVGTAFDALDRAFAAEAAGLGADPEPVASGDRSGDAAIADPFAALEQAFAAEAASSPAEPVPASDGNTDTAVADPFAALEQAFAAEAAEESVEQVAAGGGRESAAPATADPFAALEQAFAAQRDAEAAEDEEDGGAVDAEPIDTVGADPFAALDLAFAAEAAELSADEETDAGNASAASVNAGPFIALEEQFVAEVPEEVTEAAAAPEPADSADAFAALDRAFAVEAADDVAQGDAANVVDAAPEPTDANGSAAPVALVVPLEVATAADPSASATSEPANLTEWVRVVSAGVTAAEEAAGEAESAAAGTGSWFGRTTTCVNALDRLSNALQSVERLTVGEERPSYVTSAAGEETYAELGERLETARERGRAACESIGRPQ